MALVGEGVSLCAAQALITNTYVTYYGMPDNSATAATAAGVCGQITGDIQAHRVTVNCNAGAPTKSAATTDTLASAFIAAASAMALIFTSEC